MNIEPVAFFSSPLKEKFGVPRQSGLAPDLAGEVRFVPPFDAPEALRGLEGFDYCWLIWGFSLNREAAGGLTVRPPRLGGNERVGVFASRSPFRPNPLGLSCVRIESVEKGLLRVRGADLADGTPVYDVKPYVEYADSHPGVRSGFASSAPSPALKVVWSDPSMRDETLETILSQAPRPAYHDDPSRIYGLSYNGRNIRFRVEGDVLTVLGC